MAPTLGPIDRPLVVVIGKGGVGKSTVAAALAVSAARRGRRPVVVEVAGRADVGRLVGRSVAHRSIDPSHALADYLRDQLPAGPLAGLLAHDRTLGLLAAAAPGLPELLTIGKVWSLTGAHGRHAHDMVVLDAPATGHGVALLAAPRTFAEIAAHGPVRRQAEAISAFLTDRRQTGVVVVGTPEQMAVQETLDLRTLLRDGPGLEVDRVVANKLLPDRFSARERGVLAAAAPSTPVAAALRADSLARHQRTELARLVRDMAPLPVDTLPFLFAPALGPDHIAHLADVLDRAWGPSLRASA